MVVVGVRTKGTGEVLMYSLMIGKDWVLCCICFWEHSKPYPDLFVDHNGDRWDMCRGQCAVDAGLAFGPNGPVRGKASNEVA